MKKIGFIGVGHIAHYMLQGLSNTEESFEFVLADPYLTRVSAMAQEFDNVFDCYLTQNNQEAVDRSDLIILAVRPVDLEGALASLNFKPGQVVASVVAGATLDQLNDLVSPATAVRVLPIACVAMNKSPVLVFPDNDSVKEIFSMLGQVHVLPSEETFTPGTALVGAFYAWMFPLMEETASWTRDQGIDPETARTLVIETMEGACTMARHQKQMSLGAIWETLATPGGISECGARVLNENGCLKAWSQALASATELMQSKQVQNK